PGITAVHFRGVHKRRRAQCGARGEACDANAQALEGQIDKLKLYVYISAVWVRQLLFVRQKSWQTGLSRRLRKWASRKGSSFARIWSRLGKAIGPLRSSFGSPESSVTDPAISQPVRGFRKSERYRGYRLSGCVGKLARQSSRVGNARFRTGYRAASYVRARAGRDGVSSAECWAGSGDALGRFPYAYFRLR